jgi:hypothetical protein
MISTARSNYPEILKKICLPILELLPFLSYYQKRAILPYVLFLVTVAMFAGRVEPNDEVL